MHGKWVRAFSAAAIGMTVAAAAGTVSAQGAESQSSSRVAKMRETGAITLGYPETSVPFAFLDGNQKPVGYTVEICEHVVRQIKAALQLPRLETIYTPTTSATRIQLLGNGAIDLECGNTTNNVERQQQVWYTNTHFLTASRFVSKVDSKIGSINDLRGKTVVAPAGSTNIKQALEFNSRLNLGMTVVPAQDQGEAFLMVETGRVVAFIQDDIVLAGLIANAKDPKAFVISEDAFSKPEPYGVMLRKDDVAFKAVADAATSALYKSPEGAKLYDKWFMQPIPPKGANLNIPMSPAMKRAFEKPTDSPDPSAY
jgi:glutamate/aspartate transport system substrate-binding protein